MNGNNEPERLETETTGNPEETISNTTQEMPEADTPVGGDHPVEAAFATRVREWERELTVNTAAINESQHLRDEPLRDEMIDNSKHNMVRDLIAEEDMKVRILRNFLDTEIRQSGVHIDVDMLNKLQQEVEEMKMRADPMLRPPVMEPGPLLGPRAIERPPSGLPGPGSQQINTVTQGPSVPYMGTYEYLEALQQMFTMLEEKLGSVLLEDTTDAPPQDRPMSATCELAWRCVKRLDVLLSRIDL